MTDLANALLFRMIRDPASLNEALTISDGTFTVGATSSSFFGVPTAELLDRLVQRGDLEATSLRTTAVCVCGGRSFEVVLTCRQHGVPVIDIALMPGHESAGRGTGTLQRATSPGDPPSVSATSAYADRSESAREPLRSYCPQCQGPPTELASRLLCLRCGRQADQATGVRHAAEPAYRLTDGPHRSTEVLEAIITAFSESGFSAGGPVAVRGRSGVEHFYDVRAVKGAAEYLVEVLASTEAPSPQSQELSVLGYYGKLTDTQSKARHMLVAIPPLVGRAKSFAATSGLNSVEASDAKSVGNSLRLVIGAERVEARRPSGIPGLDPLLRGGLLKGEIYLVKGEPGTGKTTAATQFVVEGARHGEKGLIVVTSSTAEELVRHADRLGLALREEVRQGHVLILDVTRELEALKHQNLSDPERYRAFVDRVVGDLLQHAATVGATRTAIDTLTPLLPVPRYNEVREFLHALGRLGGVVLVTKEIEPDNATAIEEYFVAGVLALRVDRQTGGGRRVLVIQKFRGGEHDIDLHPYSIEQTAGISLTG